MNIHVIINSAPMARLGWKIDTCLLHTKFHPHRCNVSPLRGKKPQNRPMSKLNTGALHFAQCCWWQETQRFWLPRRRVKPKPHQTWHGGKRTLSNPFGKSNEILKPNASWNEVQTLQILWKSRKGLYSTFWSNLSKNFRFWGPTALSLHRWGWNLACRRLKSVDQIGEVDTYVTRSRYLTVIRYGSWQTGKNYISAARQLDK